MPNQTNSSTIFIHTLKTVDLWGGGVANIVYIYIEVNEGLRHIA